MHTSLEVKICGLTTPDQAVAVAAAGADAIGLVFYPPSPRHVSISQAREIVAAIGDECCTCGIFVDMPLERVLQIIERTGIDLLQLHGNESEAYIQNLHSSGKRIIKVLKNESFAKDIKGYSADAYLLELGKGALPGGNFQSWHWQQAKEFGLKHPYILAGGISKDNVRQAIAEGNPQALDLSSAV